MKYEQVEINKLIPYKNNARTHSDEQIKQIQASIREFGFINPVLIDKDLGIIAGHGRVTAAKNEGMEKVPCIFIEHLTEAQQKAYIIADNKLAENAGWNTEKLKIELTELQDLDFNLELTGFADMEIDELLFEEADEAKEDDFEIVLPANPKSKLGDIYQLGRHRLMCGDSTDRATVEKLMDGAKADMVFTDPPYGVSYTGGIQFKDGDAVTDNREMISGDDIDIYPAVFDILPQFVDGACYIWFAGTKAKSLYESAEMVGEIHALIIWVKNGGYGALNANYKQKHEPCLYWKPKGATLGFTGATTETTVWEINKDGVNEYHPTQKPIALASKAIGNHGGAKKVLDLFGGSGSTLIACEQLNRKCYMMELDPKYCDVIIDRWEQFTGEKAVLLNE